ncbi:hypothetical protein [Bradyrhizobium sp. WSM471]|uniref:hypothetical protein n=1 Tax=Bradyrhizobium sp. WSM471 TaxID=319017 RepID=UPI0002ED47BF|nr:MULTISPECIES: hypothetical protein [Bradyrhizobium]UFW43317.1 hypothetical protein BcanWSM471_09625 [Bradyrhizobium canariense]
MNKFISIRQATRRNQAWAIDIAMLDLDGRPIVTLVIDVHTRRPLSATVSSELSGAVTDGLDQLVRSFDRPEAIWLDYIHDHAFFPFLTWADRHGIPLVYGSPPATSALANAVLRDLGAHLQNKPLTTLMDLGHQIERWRESYSLAARTFPDIDQ